MENASEKRLASVTDLRKYREELDAAAAVKTAQPVRLDPHIDDNSFETFTWDGHAHPHTVNPRRPRNEPSIGNNVLDKDLLKATLEETDHELLERMAHAGPQSDRVFVDGKTFELLEPRGPGFPEPVSRAGLVARWAVVAALAGGVAYCSFHRGSEESPPQQNIPEAVHKALYPSPKFD